MGAAGSELDYGAAGGGVHHARGLAGDEGLESERGQQVGLRNLRFDDGRAHHHHRLTGEQRRTFRHGENIARETEAAQIVEEAGGGAGEGGQGAEVVDFLSAEVEVQQVVDGLCEAGGNDVIAICGEAADGQFEGSLLIDLAGVVVAGGHG